MTNAVGRTQATSAYLTQVTELHWATVESFNKRAYEFVFDLPQSASCNFSHYLSGEINTVGPSYMIYFQNGRSFGSSSFGQDQPVYTSVGDFETTRTSPSGRSYWVTGSRAVEGSGNLFIVTLVSEGQKPLPFASQPDISFGWSFTCDTAYDLVSAGSGNEAFIYDYSDVDGTVVGASFVGIGGGVISGEVSASIQSPRGLVFIQAIPSYQLALINIVTPEGEQSYIPTPLGGDFEAFESTSGNYSIELNRVSGPLDRLTLSISGIDPTIDISSGFLGQTLFR
nr:hypothetical protein [Oceanococcus sp. HetDA_MAG_MS8]